MIQEEKTQQLNITVSFVTLLVYLIILPLCVRSYTMHKHSRGLYIIILCLINIVMQLSSIAYHSSQNKGKHQVVYRMIDKALIYILLFFSFAPFLSGLNQAHKILSILLVLTLIFAATTCIALVYNKNTLSMVGYFVLPGIYLYFLRSVRNIINQEALDLLLFSSLILFVGVVFYLNINYRFSHVAWHVLSAASSIVVFAAIFLLN